MSDRDFAYWLQGFIELHGEPPTAAQWAQVKEHLDLVFAKVTTAPVASSSTGSTVSSGITVHGLDGKEELLSWTEYYRRQNAGKVFITVSRRPGYEAGKTYSYYPFHAYGEANDRAAQEAFLRSLGVEWQGTEVFCVVDNALEPRATELNALKGSTDHLTSLHPRAPGIVNVGVGATLFC